MSDNEGTEWTLSKERFSGSELNRTGVAMGESQMQRQLGKQPVPVVPPRATHRLRNASLSNAPLCPRRKEQHKLRVQLLLCSVRLPSNRLVGGWVWKPRSKPLASSCGADTSTRAASGQQAPQIPVDLGVEAQHAQAPEAQGGVSNTGPPASYLIYSCLINTEDLKTFLARAPDRLALRRQGEAE